MKNFPRIVIPAEAARLTGRAGNPCFVFYSKQLKDEWIPACAGMTTGGEKIFA